MSFLDDTKNFGLVMLILGLVASISALVSIADSFGNDMIDVLLYVGQVIYALMILTFGFAIYSGKILLFKDLYDQGVDSKFGILATFVTILGVANLILGALAIGNHFMDNCTDTLAAGAVNIVVGIILLIVAMFMKDGATTTMDKIIWIILAIVFILGIIGSFIGIFAVFDGGEALTVAVNLLVAICYTLMYLMLFVYLISDEVKAKMGM
ncbi:MAG: hypothetical protein GX224_05535 [Thermoplasmatales archaeon]|nr:hypothetical protein [Thermoplasmatales archaeon]